MADEATVRTSLSIVDSPEWRSYPTAFTTDVDGNKGPTPGAFTATIAGTDVDLDEITVPGLCRIANLDPTNFVTVGIWDPELGVFYPMLEVRPNEFYVMRLSRLLLGEYGTGAGSVGPNTNTLRVKADTASCNVNVSVFEA